eukprot:1086492-Rhodomonas_salina.1
MNHRCSHIGTRVCGADAARAWSRDSMAAEAAQAGHLSEHWLVLFPPLSPYALATPCPVLTCRMLPSPYARAMPCPEDREGRAVLALAADSVEAVIAAVTIDRGLAVGCRFVQVPAYARAMRCPVLA